MQSEMELAFAGIHQLCTPILDHADSIPVPQQNALRTAIGLAAGPPPDRFLVGLPELDVPGPGEQDARALLDSALRGPLDAQVRDLIVAETHGNPLALLQLPRGAEPGAAGGRVRPARHRAPGGSDRGELHAPARRPAPRDPAAAASGGRFG
jgi:hypothetical protein